MNPYEKTVIRIIRTVVRVDRADQDWESGAVVSEHELDASVIYTRKVSK